MAEQQTQEIEINFRLDGEGRTIPTADVASSLTDSQTPPVRQYESHSIMMELSCVPPTGGGGGGGGGDSSKTTTANIINNNGVMDKNHSMVDELLFDCEISDCGLMPRTFWVPSQGFEPRCNLERMALDVFRHHVTRNDCYDPETSGAEWWVQIRPSPEAGRYSMHGQSKDDENDEKDMAKSGISYHWDKDEDLRILCGGNTYIHPHLSTVTYLTGIGAPTMALNIRVNQMTGDYIVPGTTIESEKEKVEGFLSWPKFGKHLCFDGRYLHAAPSDIMVDGAFQKQCELPPEKNETDDAVKAKTPNATRKKLQRQHRRVTFLVNIWLNFKPFDVKPFPDTMITKLSGHGSGESQVSIGLPKQEDSKTKNATTHNVEVGRTTAKEETTTKEYNLRRFHWPMGDCTSKESIEADVPLDFVRNQAANGGSIRMTWEGKAGVIMSCTSASAADTIEATVVTESRVEPADATDGETESKRPRLGSK